MRMRYVLAVAVVLCFAAAAQADWINMNLSNGNFDTPGSLGTLGQTITINGGTADNGKLFAGWKALPGTVASWKASSDTTGGNDRAKAVRDTNAASKQSYGFWVHDALQKPDNSYWAIESKVYRFDYEMEVLTYQYKSGCDIYWGDTDTSSSATWKGINGYFSGGTRVAAEFFSIGPTENTGVKKFTVFWDNTGTGWTPSAGDIAGRDVTSTFSTNQIQLGQHLRFGVNSSLNGNQGSFYVDNVVASYYGVAPEPGTLALLGAGAIGLVAAWLRKRKA